MPACIPYITCLTSVSVCQYQSTGTYHRKVVCAHPPKGAQTDGSAISVDSNLGWSASSKEFNFPVSPVSNPATWWSSQSPPPLIHAKSPYSCVPLPPLPHSDVAINPLLERGTTERIDYDVRMPPLAAKNLHAFGNNDWWQFEAAANPGLGSLTIRVALVERPIVVFPANVDGEIITAHDVLLAVHYAVCMSLVNDRRPRGRPQTELRSDYNSAPCSARGEACRRTSEIELGGCYRWAGLTPSPTERDVWILMTR